MREILFHLLRRVLIVAALLGAFAAWTVAAFADETGRSEARTEGRGGERVVPAQERLGLGPRGVASTPRGEGSVGVNGRGSSQVLESTPTSLGRTGLALTAVLALIAVCAVGIVMLRRRTSRAGAARGVLAGLLGGGSMFSSARAPSGVLEVLGRFPVGPGTQLLLLKLDRRVLLVSQSATKGFRSGAMMQTLCELHEPEDVASILLKVRGEEQSQLAAQFESLLSREEEITEHTLRDPGSAPKVATAGRERAGSLRHGKTGQQALAEIQQHMAAREPGLRDGGVRRAGSSDSSGQREAGTTPSKSGNTSSLRGQGVVA